MARVWPETTVVEANLSVHITALRRALRDGRDGNRYLVNITGRGYRFVAPVVRCGGVQQRVLPRETVIGEHRLPAALMRLVGRDRELAELAEQLSYTRLLTITGPGGVGKTAVSLALAELVRGDYPHGVRWVDLASVTDPDLVRTAVAAALLPDERRDDEMFGSLSAIMGKSMLLVLDNCEHVIEAVAALAALLLRGGRGLQILASSREPIRVEGERVRRLAPLACPPAAIRPNADEALRYPAVELFVQCATAALGEFNLSDTDAPIVSEICREVDGLPLAIDFAANRVETFGIRGIASRLRDHLRVLTGVRRAELSRHQSMSASLDWSYALLSSTEQALFRRAGLLAAEFTLGAIAEVTGDMAWPDGEVIDTVMQLVAKSLVVAVMTDAEPRFRLLETTRAYALAKLAQIGEADQQEARALFNLSSRAGSMTSSETSPRGTLSCADHRRPFFHQRRPITRTRTSNFSVTRR